MGELLLHTSRFPSNHAPAKPQQRRGAYGDYFIRAESEQGEAKLHLLVVREHGQWRIRGFDVNSPVLAQAPADVRA